MSIPYPDSPNIDEYIGESLIRIKENFAYLDNVIGTSNVKSVVSNLVELSTRTGLHEVAGIDFEPRALLVFANIHNSPAYSYGVAIKGSLTTSVDNYSIGQIYSQGGYATDTFSIFFVEEATKRNLGRVTEFTRDGVKISYSKFGAPASLGNLMYIFFG